MNAAENVSELKQMVSPEPCQDGVQSDLEFEAILEDWAPGTELVTADGSEVLLEALRVLEQKLLEQRQTEEGRRGRSDVSAFQWLVACEDLAYTISLAERIEVRVAEPPEPRMRAALEVVASR